jgi:DNA-directed RNA polymerase subunit RPC12/RpoP
MQPRRGRSLAKILLRNAAERVPGMWRTRFEVKALLEKSEHTRRRVAEIQRQLQDLILYWEALLRRQGHTEAGPEQTSYNEALTESRKTIQRSTDPSTITCANCDKERAMHPETEHEFTLRCPYCRGKAAPVEVTMESRERTLKYVCSTCQKTWTVTHHELPRTAVESKWVLN